MDEFFRRNERRSLSIAGIVDKVNDLGAMAWDVACKLYCKGYNRDIADWEKIARKWESSLKKNICCDSLKGID